MCITTYLWMCEVCKVFSWSFRIFKKCADEMRVVSKKVLCLDVQTHRNATYLMLGAVLGYEKVFERFEEQDLAFVNQLKEGVMNEED